MKSADGRDVVVQITEALLGGDADLARELGRTRTLWTGEEIRRVLEAGRKMEKKYPGCPGEAIARGVLWPR